METPADIGASLSGLSTARAARAQGFAGRLNIIGDEPHRPYDRPPLSKDFLLGTIKTEGLVLEQTMTVSRQRGLWTQVLSVWTRRPGPSIWQTRTAATPSPSSPRCSWSSRPLRSGLPASVAHFRANGQSSRAEPFDESGILFRSEPKRRTGDTHGGDYIPEMVTNGNCDG